MVSRHEIGTQRQKSYRTGGYKTPSLMTFRFQPGEGPSRGLLRDYENFPNHRLKLYLRGRLEEEVLEELLLVVGEVVLPHRLPARVPAQLPRHLRLGEHGRGLAECDPKYGTTYLERNKSKCISKLYLILLDIHFK